MNKKKKWNNISKTNSLFSLRKKYIDEFRDKNEFYELIFYIKGWTKSDCFIYENDSFEDEDIEKFIKFKDELKLKPIQYVTNSAFFYGLNFYVDENVLIPRPETELIVDNIVNDKNNYEVYADVCTGSGCIAISLAHFKQIKKIFLTDISKNALIVANKNLESLKVNGETVQGDFLEPLLSKKIKLNLLTINPPYIDVNDENIADLVRNNEPHLALFADDNGLHFYKELFSKLDNIMDTTKPFKVLCEFGFQQKEDIEQLYLKSGLKYKTEFEKDYQKYWRYFIISN